MSAVLGTWCLNREQEKQRASKLLHCALTAIQEQGREPDLWERDRLLHGVSAHFRGQYSLALQQKTRSFHLQDEVAVGDRLKIPLCRSVMSNFSRTYFA